MCKGVHLDTVPMDEQEVVSVAGGKAEEHSSPEKVHRLSVLRDLYEGLLPPRQREVMAMKLDEDLSLAEMAERLGVSRQACEDSLKRAEKALFHIEGQLGFGKRQALEKKCLDEASEALFGMTAENWAETRDLALTLIRTLLNGGEADNGI